MNLDPVWSPDGSKIGFVRNEPGNQFHIYYMPFEGGRAGNMVQLTNQNSFGRARLYFNQNDDHIQPTWSPDGKEMILVSNRNIPLGSGALWRMPVEPDGMRKATDDPARGDAVPDTATMVPRWQKSVLQLSPGQPVRQHLMLLACFGRRALPTYLRRLGPL